jgi:two-component system, cell cycle response regulator DivK
MARILVVEDNPQNLKLATVILESDGHTVVPAVDSAGANRALSEQIPDLIVMDMALPGTDGYTLTRELRGRSDTSRLPILALSAFAMPGDAEKALAAGCSDYLTKPIRRAVLLECVASLLGSRGGHSTPEDVAPRAGGESALGVDGR